MNRQNAAIRDSHTAARGNETIRAHNYHRVFGRLNDDGNVDVLTITGEAATTLRDATELTRPQDVTAVYPVGASSSCAHEHPEGIVLSRADAVRLGIEIEE